MRTAQRQNREIKTYRKMTNEVVKITWTSTIHRLVLTGVVLGVTQRKGKKPRFKVLADNRNFGEMFVPVHLVKKTDFYKNGELVKSLDNPIYVNK